MSIPCIKCGGGLPEFTESCMYCGTSQILQNIGPGTMMGHTNPENSRAGQYASSFPSPQAFSPQAVSPQAVSPQAFSPQAVSPASPLFPVPAVPGQVPLQHLGIQNAPLAPNAHQGSANHEAGGTMAVKPLRSPEQDAKVREWNHSLVTLLLTLGILLLACFVAPWSITDENVSFSFTVLAAPTLAWTVKLFPLLLAGTGFVAIVIATLNISFSVKAVLTAVIGIAPITILFLMTGPFHWPSAVGNVGMFLMIGGLVIRNWIPSRLIGRFITSVGALATLVVFVVPDNGGMLVQGLFQQTLDSSGLEKLGPLIGVQLAALSCGLIPLCFTIFSVFLVWLPFNMKGVYWGIACILMVWGLIAFLAFWGLAGANFAVLKEQMALLFSSFAYVAWLSFAAFGIAGFLSEKAEH